MKKTAIILVMVAVGTFAIAQPGPRPERNNQHQMERPADREFLPDLTDQQKDKIKEIRVNAGTSISPLKNQLMEKRAHLNTLVSSETPNQKDVESTISDISKLQAEIMNIEVKSRIEIRSLLTDEQKLHFDKKMAAREREMKNRGVREHHNDKRHND